MTKRFSFVRVLMIGVGLTVASTSLSGCLLLAKRVVNDIGEECSKDQHCPADWAFCGQPSSGPAICLPLESECASENDPICSGYACEVGDINYCHRFCEKEADCAEGFTCEYEGLAAKGECRDDGFTSSSNDDEDEDECTATDVSACRGYSCRSGNYCATICTSTTPCATGYTCNDDYTCVRL